MKKLLLVLCLGLSWGFAQTTESLSFGGMCTVAGKPVYVSMLLYAERDSTHIRGGEFFYQLQDRSTTCSYNFFFCLIKDSAVYLATTRDQVLDGSPDAYLKGDEMRFVNNSFFSCKPDQENVIMKRLVIEPKPEEVVVFEISNKTVGNEEQVDGEESIVDFAEVEPQFPGGEEAMKKFIAENIQYPADGADVSGTVYVQFVVNTDGLLTDIRVIRGVAKSLDAEAIRIISIMPKWKPGEQGGKVCAVRYIVPVRFVIE